jgi:acyl carrier protein
MAKIKQVFISHDREDAQFAHRLASDLQQLGVRVWIAPESIRPGEDWVDAINRGLGESSHMLVVLTPAAVSSRWVRAETNVAIRLEREGRMQMIPLDVKPCDAPLLWTGYQMVSFHRDYETGLRQLAEILDLRVPPVTPLARPAERAPEPATAILGRFKTLLVEQLGLDEALIRPQSRLAEDLEMDELDLVELTMAVEEEWGGEIPDSDLFKGDALDPEGWKLRTVGDWVAYLTRRLGR